ncbi:hypothetical protein LNP74_26640 [Klebsiella pneumoniae subsp. pneumoniae]|nr:hypothetical protein [Klebsiella pneumoniae subsp. pneumoniae]
MILLTPGRRAWAAASPEAVERQLASPAARRKPPAWRSPPAGSSWLAIWRGGVAISTSTARST